MVEGSKVHLKEGRVRKRTTLGMRNKRWWKNTKIFFYGLILMGGLPRLKFLKSEKFSKSNFNLSHFKAAFHLMDPVKDFSCELCKTHCPMSQRLDDMHASLLYLKYRPPFLLNLLIA